MEKNYFDELLGLMRAYIKMLRLELNGHDGWIRLRSMPQNYELLIFSKLDPFLTKGYESSSDWEWQEKISYYKKTWDAFEAEFKLESQKQLETILSDRQRYNYLYKQNQSYVRAFKRTRQRVNSWLDETFISDKKELEKNLSEPSITNQTDNQPASLLFITPQSKQALYDDLYQYVEETQHLALSELIFKAIKPHDSIIVTCTVKEFGLTFYETGAVPIQGGNRLSEQLPTYFLRNDGASPVPFKPSHLVKYLRGKDKNK